MDGPRPLGILIGRRASALSCSLLVKAWICCNTHEELTWVAASLVPRGGCYFFVPSLARVRSLGRLAALGVGGGRRESKTLGSKSSTSERNPQCHFSWGGLEWGGRTQSSRLLTNLVLSSLNGEVVAKLLARNQGKMDHMTWADGERIAPTILRAKMISDALGALGLVPTSWRSVLGKASGR